MERKVKFNSKEYDLSLPEQLNSLEAELFKNGKGLIPDKKSSRLAAFKLLEVSRIDDPTDLIFMSGVSILKYGENVTKNGLSVYELKVTKKRIIVHFEPGFVVIETAGPRKDGVLGLGKN